MDWVKTELNDKNKFEFATPAKTEEFELSGERQKDGKWSCKLIQFPGGTAGKPLPVAGSKSVSFIADSPDAAKKIAAKTIAGIQKED